MIGEILILERVRRVAPLGIRFWDASTAGPAVEGLAVRVYPAGEPRRRVPAMPNHSGVFVAHALPGIPGPSAGGDDGLGGPPRPFVVEVADLSRRFQPFTLAVDLPARGPVGLACGSPPSPPTAAVPVFSTPSRPRPAGAAVVRADLWDVANERAAAWALLAVECEGRVVGLGMADREGKAAAIFPYPLRPMPGGGPGDGRGGGPTWPIGIRVSYEPWPPPAPEAPDLCRVLGQRPAALVDVPWIDGPPALELGRELVLRSSSRPELLVNPAA